VDGPFAGLRPRISRAGPTNAMRVKSLVSVGCRRIFEEVNLRRSLGPARTAPITCLPS
jgi:hypothetical protein